MSSLHGNKLTLICHKALHRRVAAESPQNEGYVMWFFWLQVVGCEAKWAFPYGWYTQTTRMLLCLAQVCSDLRCVYCCNFDLHDLLSLDHPLFGGLPADWSARYKVAARMG